MKKFGFKHTLLAAGVFSLLVVGLSLAVAQEYTSVREVRQDATLSRDFNLQGEYLAEAGDAKFGMQLIADGGGKFRYVVYRGGLPGAGWNTGDFRSLGTAAVDGDNGLTFKTANIFINGNERAIDNAPEQKVTWKSEQPQRQGQAGGQGGGQRPQGQPGAAFGAFGPRIVLEGFKMRDTEVTFTKTQRRSETLGARAPEGAVVIFDGTNVDMFEPGAKINEAPAPQGGQGGGNRPQGQGQGQRPAGFGNTLWAEATAKPFEQKPYTLHVEFMLSYMPTARGQARSNSGVYIDEAYECQVLDSFGLELANNECGGFYQIAAPSINVCFPPLTWQTYDFDVTPPKYDADGKKVANAKITVKHNGVVIHDNITLPRETPGRKPEANEKRGVYLQGHGNKVQYRNIWLKYND